MDLPPPAVLLDLYDTLVDGDWYGWRTQLSTLTGIDEETLGMRLPPDPPGPEHRAPIRPRTACGRCSAPPGSSRRPRISCAASSRPRRRSADEVRLYDDSLPTVAALRERGDAHALVSNCSNATRPIVEQLGLPALFDAVILSFEVGVRKPEPGIYRRRALGAIEPPRRRGVRRRPDLVLRRGRALGIDTRLIVRDGAEPAEGFAPSTNGHAVITDLTALL